VVNGGAQGTYFRPKTPPTERNYAIFGLKTGRFRAKWDAQKSGIMAQTPPSQN
jgi:hypothetical protein